MTNQTLEIIEYCTKLNQKCEQYQEAIKENPKFAEDLIKELYGN